MDITGPMSGETSMAAVIFGALFSIRPSAASELETKHRNMGNLRFQFKLKSLCWFEANFRLKNYKI